MIKDMVTFDDVVMQEMAEMYTEMDIDELCAIIGS